MVWSIYEYKEEEEYINVYTKNIYGWIPKKLTTLLAYEEEEEAWWWRGGGWKETFLQTV